MAHLQPDSSPLWLTQSSQQRPAAHPLSTIAPLSIAAGAQLGLEARWLQWHGCTRSLWAPFGAVGVLLAHYRHVVKKVGIAAHVQHA